MLGTPAIYLGRIVSKDNFRVFIHSPDGTQRLVESWSEYQDAMATGNWFATLGEVKAHQESIVVKPKRTRRSSKAVTAVEMLEDDEIEETEASDTDGFLPTESK